MCKISDVDRGDTMKQNTVAIMKGFLVGALMWLVNVLFSGVYFSASSLFGYIFPIFMTGVCILTGRYSELKKQNSFFISLIATIIIPIAFSAVILFLSEFFGSDYIMDKIPSVIIVLLYYPVFPAIISVASLFAEYVTDNAVIAYVMAFIILLIAPAARHIVLQFNKA